MTRSPNGSMETNPMLLIVNADDLGASQAVNDEIFELMDAGLVTSATLMANGPAFQDAVRRVRQFPHCSFGVHLNLTSFRPLSDPGELKPILKDGEFCLELLTKKALRELRKAVERELMMQVQKVADAGVPVTHLDSHHFIHLRPALFPVIKTVQRHFGIRRVRSSREAMAKSGVKRLQFRVMDFALRNLYATITPNGWCEFRKFHAQLVHHGVPHFRSLELMVHPGSQNRAFAEEIALLRTDWRTTLPASVKIGSYHLLNAA